MCWLAIFSELFSFSFAFLRTCCGRKIRTQFAKIFQSNSIRNIRAPLHSYKGSYLIYDHKMCRKRSDLIHFTFNDVVEMYCCILAATVSVVIANIFQCIANVCIEFKSIHNSSTIRCLFINYSCLNVYQHTSYTVMQWIK